MALRKRTEREESPGYTEKNPNICGLIEKEDKEMGKKTKEQQ